MRSGEGDFGKLELSSNYHSSTPRVGKRARCISLVSHVAVVVEEDVCIVRCIKLDAVNRRSDYSVVASTFPECRG